MIATTLSRHHCHGFEHAHNEQKLDLVKEIVKMKKVHVRCVEHPQKSMLFCHSICQFLPSSLPFLNVPVTELTNKDAVEDRENVI